MAPAPAEAVSPERAAALVKARALALGFDSAGVSDLAPPTHRDALDRWLDAGYDADMRYLTRQAPLRRDPARIVPGATHAIVVTKNYLRPDPPRPPESGRVARYARGRDYHRALRRPLLELAAYVQSLGNREVVARWFVDAGPVPERELAQRAGLGWIGKNTMLIDPRRGSYTYLASVFTNLPLAADSPFQADRCGTCRRCLDACPTAAFVEPRVLDSRRCISYLTIENRGPVPDDLAGLVGDWIFGCDVCQEVCPWNERFAQPVDGDAMLEFRPELAALTPRLVRQMDDEALSSHLRGTALARAGAAGMRRNAEIVARNIAEPRATQR